MRSKRIKLPTKWALSKELTVIISVKVLLILLIWRVFFYHPAIDQLNTKSVGQHFYGPALTQQNKTSPSSPSLRGT
jgi:hypothetical protein